ncbi:MAG: 3-methyladenine DNA glycosylase [Campylobacteraceae bacterium]|jgi:endonuclease-3 related protein|nr:3-methyladenine DNA glycosylase [Campylobacteraceae bacterium]
MNSFELLSALKQLGYLKPCERLWWPNSGSFEVVVAAILTQQTKWSNVEISLLNLKNRSLMNPHALALTDEYEIGVLIEKSGFKTQKASRLKKLAHNIMSEFGSFESFQQNADREWLLAQKGIGFESADAILCYACLKPVMVIDSYTGRLLSSFGYEFESYDEIQEWFYGGILSRWENVCGLYNFDIDENTLFARFHGKIVEFCKENMRGQKIDISAFADLIQ